MPEIAEVDRLRTIAVLNQKGGVGKTTTTVNAAAALAAFGMKVIVIDLDPQAHLTIHLGVEPQTVQTGSYEVLTQSADFESSLMMTRPNLWLLGANINLVGAETELVTVVGREIILREAMETCREQFDYCLIDCAPSLGLLSLNALAASQEVLIPLQPHFLALQGFGKLLQTVDLVNKRINPNLKVSGVLLCMFDTRASLPNEVRADIDRFLTNARGSNSAWADAQILPTFIRRNIKLAESPSYGQTIFEYDPTCNGAADYRNVARFFLGLEPQTGEAPEAEPETEAEPVVEPVELAPPVEEGPVVESVPASEPVTQPESQESHDRAEMTDNSNLAAEAETMAGPETADVQPDSEATSGSHEPHEDKPSREGESWDLHHTPQLLSNPDPALQQGHPAEQTPAESTPNPHSELAPGDTPEPKPWEMHAAPDPAPAPQEAHHEPEPVNEHDAQVRQDRPPIEIHEFQLPAPPLQSFPTVPAESSEHEQSEGEAHVSPGSAPDDPNQMGY